MDETIISRAFGSSPRALAMVLSSPVRLSGSGPLLAQFHGLSKRFMSMSSNPLIFSNTGEYVLHSSFVVPAMLPG